jgi:hypothetical protein
VSSESTYMTILNWALMVWFCPLSFQFTINHQLRLFIQIKKCRSFLKNIEVIERTSLLTVFSLGVESNFLECKKNIWIFKKISILSWNLIQLFKFKKFWPFYLLSPGFKLNYIKIRLMWVYLLDRFKEKKSTQLILKDKIK